MDLSVQSRAVGTPPCQRASERRTVPPECNTPQATLLSRRVVDRQAPALVGRGYQLLELEELADGLGQRPKRVLLPTHAKVQ